MPRKYTKTNPKRRVVKKRTYRKRYNRKTRVRSLVTPSKVVRLKYVDRITIDPGIAVAASHIFNLHSIYDPDFTGTGHQPMYHDTLQTLYNHYMVLGCRIKVTPMINTDGGAFSGLYGLHIKDNSTAISDVTQLIEQNRCRYKPVNGQTATFPLKFKYNPRALFSYSNIKDQRYRFGTAFGASPAEAAYLHLFCSGANASQNPTAMDFLVELNYTVLVDEPQDIGQS